MKSYAFTVPGTPRALSRPRGSFRNGKPHFYTDTKSRKHQKLIRECLAKSVEKSLVDRIKPEPIELRCSFFFRVPDSWENDDRVRAYRLGWHTSTPDLDNLVKMVSDALNGKAYVDDRQVVRVVAQKAWGASPKTNVAIVML